jgi:hypothetical protein
MRNRNITMGSALILAACVSLATAQTDKPTGSAAPAPPDTQKVRTLSFAADVAPVISKACLPCHAAESENPSGLSLDNIELLMKGGEHGTPVVAGKPDDSILFTKLAAKPPFGRQMPRKRPPLSVEEMNLISAWIVQGAKP